MDAVSAATVIIEKNRMQQWVEVDVYLWNGDTELSDLPWDFEIFKRDRLEDRLDTFSWMELIG